MALSAFAAGGHHTRTYRLCRRVYGSGREKRRKIRLPRCKGHNT